MILIISSFTPLICVPLVFEWKLISILMTDVHIIYVGYSSLHIRLTWTSDKRQVYCELSLDRWSKFTRDTKTWGVGSSRSSLNRHRENFGKTYLNHPEIFSQTTHVRFTGLSLECRGNISERIQQNFWSETGWHYRYFTTDVTPVYF